MSHDVMTSLLWIAAMMRTVILDADHHVLPAHVEEIPRIAISALDGDLGPRARIAAVNYQ